MHPVTVQTARRIAGTAHQRRTGDMSEAMPADIIVGVDTHKHTHAAVALTAWPSPGSAHAQGS